MGRTGVREGEANAVGMMAKEPVTRYQVERLQWALTALLKLIEDGELVRDVSRDGEAHWLVRATRVSMVIRDAQAVLDEIK